MAKINIEKTIQHILHNYITREVVTVVVGLVAIIIFFTGSVLAMQKNYELSRKVGELSRAAQVAELETRASEYEQRYYKTEEYKRLAVRERLSYGDPGEKLLYLPANSPQAVATDKRSVIDITKDSPEKTTPSNFSQWMTFLFGGNAASSGGS